MFLGKESDGQNYVVTNSDVDKIFNDISSKYGEDEVESIKFYLRLLSYDRAGAPYNKSRGAKHKYTYQIGDYGNAGYIVWFNPKTNVWVVIVTNLWLNMQYFNQKYGNHIVEYIIRKLLKQHITENRTYKSESSIYIKESQLRRLVRECIHEALQNRRTRV